MASTIITPQPNNSKLVHLYQLISLCRTLQDHLLGNGRNLQNDYVIFNLYELVSRYPLLPFSQLLSAYEILLKTPWNQLSETITIGEGRVFTARSTCLL